MKFNKPDTIRSHKTKDAAIKKAGDFGMIYDTEIKLESQVHAMSNNTLKAHSAGTRGHYKMGKSFQTHLLELKLLFEN